MTLTSGSDNCPMSPVNRANRFTSDTVSSSASETRNRCQFGSFCSLIRACSSLISLRTADVVTNSLNSNSPTSSLVLFEDKLLKFCPFTMAFASTTQMVSFGRFRGGGRNVSASKRLRAAFGSSRFAARATHGEVDIIITRYCCTGFFRMMLSVSIRAPTSALLK